MLTLVLGAAIYWAIRSEFRSELDQRVATEHAAVLRDARSAGLLKVVVDRTAHEHGEMRYALLDSFHRQIAGEQIAGAPKPGWSKVSFVERDGSRHDARAIASLSDANALLVVGTDSDAIEELTESTVPLLILVFGLIAVIGVGGAFFLGRTLRRRLDLIERTASAIIAGDSSQRIPISDGGDEFDRLSETLNRMLDRNGALLENLRQVSCDIAHDLRTPLARLRQKLDRVLTDDHDICALRQSVRQGVAQTDSILELFTDLLSISEVEARGAGVRLRPVDLSVLVSDLAESYQPSAEDGNRVLIREIEPGIVVNGNRELLAQLVVNLLDNALRHTPRGTAIAIALAAQGNAVELVVSDTGPGIPAEERERVFERFIRLEGSRSTSGHGLGLSLVAAIVRAHSGTVTLGDNEPGVKMVVVLMRGAR